MVLCQCYLTLVINVFGFLFIRQAISWEATVTEKRKIDHKVTALVGRNATLECPTQGKDEHRVAWINQESRTILSLHGELVTQSNRYAIIKKELGSFDLLITNVQESDAGTYICQINSNPMRNLVIFLYVVKSPSIKPILVDKIEARIGHSARMECLSEGIPQPSITWKKFLSHGNVIIVAENSRLLEIRNLSRHDAGQYMCIANNGYPPTVSHTFYLAVMYKPLIAIKFKYQHGISYQITCHIRAHPRPLEFGIRGIEHKQLIREEFGDGFHIFLSANITVDQNKEFECYAQNEAGQNNKFVSINSEETTETVPWVETKTTLAESATSPMISSHTYVVRKKFGPDLERPITGRASRFESPIAVIALISIVFCAAA